MKLLTAFILVTLSVNCATPTPAISMKDTAAAIPACIQKFIERNKTNWQIGSVEEYEFQGKLVYAFGPAKNIRDGSTLIKSADCKDMCNIGGFAGPRNSNCNGENFYEKAVFKRKIWEAGQ